MLTSLLRLHTLYCGLKTVQHICSPSPMTDWDDVTGRVVVVSTLGTNVQIYLCERLHGPGVVCGTLLLAKL